MLEPKLAKIAKNLIETSFRDSSANFHREIGEIMHYLASQGLANSGVMLQQLEEVSEKELESRADIILKSFTRTFSTAESTDYDELTEYLKELALKYLTQAYSEVTSEIARYTKPNINSPGIDLSTKHNNVERKTYAEVDLFVESLRNKEGQKGTGNAVTNITAENIGAVQTGAGSTATVIQIITPEIKVQLNTALTEIEESIKAGQVTTDFTKEELLEMVAKSREEIQKESPSLSRLKTSLTSVAIAIQAIGGLSGAYRVLKSVLSPLGVEIP